MLDENKQPMISAAVQVYQGGILKGGAATDYDGNYTIKPLEAGLYNVLVLYTGYDSLMETGVVVTPGGRTTRNYNMEVHKSTTLTAFKVIAYKKPLVNQDEPSKRVLTGAEIAAVPTQEITDVLSLNPGLYQSRRGSAVNIGGARTDGTLYIIDGVQVSSGQAGINMSQGSVDQLEVITSGIPANYGDVSGGVVNITSRGVAQSMTGQVRLQKSIDGYNNNLASFSIAGPIYKKKVKVGETTVKKPVFGFALSGDFYNDHNRYPSYYRQYVAKADVLKEIQETPFRIQSDNNGVPVYYYASNYIRKSDMEQVKIPPHNRIQEARINGKLDYQLSDNIHVIGGTSINYAKQDVYNRALIMFSPQATPVRNTIRSRSFIRFTQKFGKSNDTSSKQSIISNAYYSVQADFQKDYVQVQDPNFKRDVFKYGYIGKFTEQKTNLYIPYATDSVTGRTGTILQTTIYNSLFGDGVSFERSDLNPILANYTSQFYNSLNGLKPTTINQLQARNALANGDQPDLTYSQVFSPGQTITSYSFSNNNQYALTVDASFDLLLGKTKHAIEFGMYYQQRVNRNYFATGNLGTVGTQTLWSQMRQLVSSVNNGNLVLDRENPLFKVNGKVYTKADIDNGIVNPGVNDTIFYNYKNIGSGNGNGLGTNFDQNLRAKLKSMGYKDANGNEITNTSDIFIDALDPSVFSLDMFSADELLANGRSFVGYQGYTYTGQVEKSNVNFNDFWTQKDAKGNYTRPIGAFSPNYIAGYVLDKFNYKDMHFNIGVRVDRYSANTKVLVDPYSLYAEKNVGQVAGTGNNANKGKHPDNIGNNYIVYVDDNASSNPNIIGYRNGNNWYDPTGKYIEDPAVLKQYSGGRDPQPFLVKDGTTGNYARIIDSNFNPNSSFTDYTPQVTVQPRLQFSFPISDVADFYAHYDIYAQRPTTNSAATPVDFYFLQQNANQIIDNPNLKPQKIFDYEVGFQQKLTDHSALTLSAFYKERKNMVQLQPYLYAFPTTYYTYGNRDFSTTKGTTLFYDMRATNHLRMNISYTLQFAEGTGSSPTSTNSGGGNQVSANGLLQSFIQAGLPNMRYVYALDYDARHVLAAQVEYRFQENEGPVVAGKHILQRAGVNFVPRARSGEPYTRFREAVGRTVIGGVNGSRIPWHFGVDLRADKDFALNFGKKKNGEEGASMKPKRNYYLKAILQVNNLLNTREVMNVYNYTGKPDDNGFLTSSYGRQAIPQQINPESYKDIYSIMNNDPNNFNYARTANIALQFNF